MNNAKRSRPLLLEQLEDRSLFAAGMMWFVADNAPMHARGARELGEIGQRHSDQSHKPFDQRDDRNHLDLPAPTATGYDRPSASIGRPSMNFDSPSRTFALPDSTSLNSTSETAVIIVPMFQLTFKPSQQTPIIPQNTNATASNHSAETLKPVSSQTLTTPQPQAALGDAGNRPGPPPGSLNSTFASANNSHPEPMAPTRHFEGGAPQAAPVVEGNRGTSSSIASAAPTVSVQSNQSFRSTVSEARQQGPTKDATILLVTPSGHETRPQEEQLEWIPSDAHSDALTKDDEWKLPEPTLRELKALTRPSNVIPQRGINRLPDWFAERSGMIVLNSKAELPTVDPVDAENVDVVLGAMMGINRVITVASSMVDDPFRDNAPSQLLEAIDEALADKLPLPRESTKLNAMAYPAVALIASAIAAAKRYRGNGRMEHTRDAGCQ